MAHQVSQKLIKKLDYLIEEAIKKRMFSACSIGFVECNQDEYKKHMFNYGYESAEDGARLVTENSIFDLASLTKPLVTALSLVALIEDKKCDLNDTLSGLLGNTLPEKKNIKLFDIINHSAGFSAHKKFYTDLENVGNKSATEKIVARILQEPLEYKPTTKTVYSDLGFIILGKIIENLTGNSLDEYWKKRILSPLGLQKRLIFAQKEKISSRVPVATKRLSSSNKDNYALVHDDNCRVMGGVAGHAGLFGTLTEVINFCEIIIDVFKGRQRTSPFSSISLHHLLNQGRGDYRFGFDTPTTGVSSSGQYFSKNSIGHLGYTGTSFWIDLENSIGIVMLTNRTIYGDDLQGLRGLRPVVHDEIMKYLLENDK